MYFQERKRKKGSSWYVFIDYKDIYGRKQTYSKGGFKTKKLAREHGMQMETELNETGRFFNKNLTFNELFEDYMETVGKPKYSKATIKIYMKTYNKHIKNSVGQCKIKDLHYRELQIYFNSLESLGKATNLMIKKIIGVIFKYALKNGYIKENPVPMVEVRGHDNHFKTVEIITFEQLQGMTAILSSKKSKCHDKFLNESIIIAMYLAYFLGLRKSEVLALVKSDIDFKTNSVYIDKRLEYHELKRNEFYVTHRMKTQGSKAKLVLVEPLKEILMEWFKKNPYDLICPNENGDFLHPITMDIYLKKIGKEIGINFRFHVLRHSFATNCIKSGASVNDVAKLCRHANVTTTLNIYTHTTENDLRDTINKVYNTDFYKKPNQNLTKSKKSQLN